MRQFGLIGYPLGHSFSKAYFANKFVQEGITDCQYDAFELEQINDLKALLIAYPNLIGLNVTIPYKEQVLPFVDVLSPAVQSIGAANVLKINHGIITAYNTDIIGFRQTFCSKLQSQNTAALVLGTGGASKAVQYVLQQLGIGFLVVSRNNKPNTNSITYTDITKGVLQQYSIIINCTPLGMHPHITTCPPLPYEYLTPQHYLYDLVYKPAQTFFLQKGQEQGCTVLNGYDMLTIQAEASWKIWNETK